MQAGSKNGEQGAAEAPRACLGSLCQQHSSAHLSFQVGSCPHHTNPREPCNHEASLHTLRGTEAAGVREPHRRWVILWWALSMPGLLAFTSHYQVCLTKHPGWWPSRRVRCWFILQHVWSAPPFLLRPLRFLYSTAFASCLMLGPDLENDLPACLILIHCKSLCCNHSWLHGKLTHVLVLAEGSALQ